MNDRQVTAHTIREAFAAGSALVRGYFWRCAGLVVVLLLLSFLGSATRFIMLKAGLPVLNVVNGFMWAAIYGILNIGLYRGLWMGLSGQSIGIGHLFWGFRLPSRWRLPLLWAVISLPLLFLPAQQAHAPVPPPPAWLWPLGPVYLVVGIVVGYAFALTARFDVGPRDALRMAMGIFRKGKRRWLALPLLAALAMMGAAMLIVLLVVLAAVLAAPLHLGKPAIGLLGVGIALPLMFALLMAIFPWMGGAMLAASGSLADADPAIEGS